MNQAAPSESFERPLAEAAQTSDRSPAPGDHDITAALDPFQILAEAIVQFSDPDFALPGM